MCTAHFCARLNWCVCVVRSAVAVSDACRIPQLHEWNAAIQTGSQVFAALSNVATRLPVVTSACDATTSSAVVDAAVAASFPDLPQLLLDKHLTEAETQLANLRLIMYVM